MSYRTVLVNLDVDSPANPIVKAAADIARRFEGKLIGFCSADAALPVMSPEGGAISVEIWQEQQREIETRFRELRAEFEEAAGDGIDTEWREALDNPTRALAYHARAADLIVMGAAKGAASGDTYRSADPGSILLQAGRPVLVAAGTAETVPLGKVVVAWKDTREARRAVADALPLLKAAGEVFVVTVDANQDGIATSAVADIAGFLSRHGIKAVQKVIESREDSSKLAEFISSVDADLVVSGAYGHSRLREWVFGGVTRSLLDTPKLNRFMAS